MEIAYNTKLFVEPEVRMVGSTSKSIKIPYVSQAIVLAIEHQGIEILVSYVVTTKPLDSAELTADLSQKLPEYMVPQSFTSIDKIPVTSNGKLDRKALPKPQFTANNEYIAPRNKNEQALQRIWQDILGLDQVGMQDNFFRIGGNSLTAIKLSAACRKLLKKDINQVLLYRFPTIEKLAAQIDEQTLLQIPLGTI